MKQRPKTTHPFGPVVRLPWQGDRYDPNPPRLRGANWPGWGRKSKGKGRR